MSLSHLYQDFGPIGTRPAAILGIQDDSLEDLELEAFENGYKAGWDDATKVHVSEQERAVIAIAQRLEDLSFTHAEATTKITSAMQPLLSKITLCLLPEIAKNALGAHVAEQLDDLLRGEVESAIEIAVAPETLEPLQKQLEGRSNLSLDFTAEPMLTSGQVYLRARKAEREINLDMVLDGIEIALDAFFTEIQQEEDSRHG